MALHNLERTDRTQLPIRDYYGSPDEERAWSGSVVAC